jgi:hypothetical protein
MSRGLLAFAVLNWIAAVAVVPIFGFGNGALKLRVMSYYNQLLVNGVINEEHLAKVGWEKLPGTDLQKAQEYFLGSATSFYARTAWCGSMLLIANGCVFFSAFRNHRRSCRPRDSSTITVPRQPE